VPSMPQPSPSNQPDAADEVVLGVDTHKDVHAGAVVNGLGAVLDRRCFPTTTAGYQQLLTWARGFGTIRQAGVECTGSYGKALARSLCEGGIEVVEVNQPDRSERRRRGKTDPIDAESAARAVLSGRAKATAKTSDGPAEMLRLFKLAKSSAIKSRTQTINQLKNVLVTADPQLRDTLTGMTTKQQVRRCAQFDVSVPDDIVAATIYTLRLLAQRVLALTDEIDGLNKKMTGVISAHCPKLLERKGIGPGCAAELLIAAGDNPDRLHKEGSFAALCGTSPVEASSGNTNRRRLNRGGNRAANSALYMIVITRLSRCAATRAYVERRTQQGLSKRDIIRCLKRYVAREVYQIITEQPQNPHTSPTAA
jgi:transposase